MGATKQTQDPVSGWMEMQSRMWEAWRQVPQAPAPELAAPLLEQPAVIGEAMVDFALQTQVDAARAWLQMIEASGMDGPVVDTARRMECLTEECARIRRDAWHGFFGGLRGLAAQAEVSRDLQ